MKGISLLSSGIDSPVATYLISSYVDEIVLMHADIRPYTEDIELENFKIIASHLSSIIKSRVKICIVPHGKSLDAFGTHSFNNRFYCVFCKRMMIRYAEKYADRNNIDFIIMGDSLGQVASQTLDNIMVIDETVSIPIVRPLIGFDKEEIINIAKRIKTYDFSIKQSIGCIAVPNKPVTKAKIEKLYEFERLIQINDLVNDAINNLQYF